MECNVEYIDISPLLRAAASALPSDTKTVIHGEAFSLFEAMSAVEIGEAIVLSSDEPSREHDGPPAARAGNKKMDVGMQAQPKTIDELLEAGMAPTDLSPKQRLAVMERLLEMEATWQTGGSLAQTVFSCLYMLKPDR